MPRKTEQTEKPSVEELVIAEVAESAESVAESEAVSEPRPEVVETVVAKPLEERLEALERRVIGTTSKEGEGKIPLHVLNRRSQEVASARRDEVQETAEAARRAVEQAFAGKRRHSDHSRRDRKDVSPIAAAARMGAQKGN